MIVRINQIDVLHAEQRSGWPLFGLSGPLDFTWPEDTFAYEILILETDEQKQPLARGFRQIQLRQLIPEVLEAFREEDEELVARLDGPVVDGELADAFKYLTEQDGYGRFAFAGVAKAEARSAPPLTSVRLHLQPRLLPGLCANLNLGLDREVRWRASSLPQAWVGPFLEIEQSDDARWEQILPHAGFVLGTTRRLSSLHLITRRFDPPTAKQRLMSRLLNRVPQ